MSTKFNAAFWKWFGKSKVVDSNGDPLVVYHGTDSDFNQFYLPGEIEGRHPSSALGIFFTASKLVAKEFSNSHPPKIVPAYLSIKNPFIMKWGEFRRRFVTPALAEDWGVAEKAEEFSTQLTYDKYDGILIKKSVKHANTIEADADSWVAFYPTQIKSVDNDGTWDADDPDIRSNPGLSRLESEAQKILRRLR